MAEVALLGAGRMGSAMARRLVLAGHHVRVWNRTSERATQLVAEAGSSLLRATASPSEAAVGGDVVLSMLANGDVTCEVLLDQAFTGAVPPGRVVIDLGTSGVTASARLSRELRGCEIAFVDAPVSGSVAAVNAGTLLVMASGEQSDVDSVRAVLGAFASRTLHVGVAGQGQVMKLVVNLVVHHLNSAVAEALALATKAGVDPGLAYSVLEQSVVGAPFVKYKRDAFLNHPASVAMSLDLVAKDLDLITSYARAVGVPVSTTNAVQDQVDAALAAGCGSLDMAALARWITTTSAVTGTSQGPP